MNDFVDSFAYWLADFYLATTVLLAAALGVMFVCRQSVKRLAVAKATIVAIALLAGFSALPGWSVVSLGGSEATPAASSVFVSIPQGTTTVVEPERSSEPGPIAPLEATIPAAASWQIRWLSIVVWVYLLGSTSIAVWLLAGALAAARLVRQADAAPPVLWETIEKTAGLARLRVSREIGVPVAIGVWRPSVLFPRQWIETRSTRELATVLAHEAAHVRNGDLTWLAASRLLLVALWAQPLYWWLRRSMRLDQETLADAAAAELSSRETYAEQLVAWARAIPHRSRPALASAVGLWESPSQLRRRVALLLDEHFPVLRECSRWLRWSSVLTCGCFAIALSAVTFQPTLSEPTEEVTIPERLIVGDRYVLCKVTTDLQQRLIANDSWPHADASACLIVNYSAFADEKIDADSPVLKELSETLAKWAKADNSRLIAKVYVKPYTDDEVAEKSRDRAYELAKQLQSLGTAAGYRQSIWGVVHLADLSFDWKQFVSDAESLSANSTPDSENGIGNDRVRVFAVNTFLSRLLATSDCVIDIVPVLQSADAENFPQAFQSSIDEFVPQLKYVRQDLILLRISCPMSIREWMDAWVDDAAGRMKFASELGFKNCNLSTAYVAEPEKAAKADDVADRADSPAVVDEAISKPDSGGGITHGPLGLPVSEDELAGVVKDESGKPLAGVTVDAWTWFPGNETTTDGDGRFTLRGLDAREPVELQFTKAGFCPRLFVAEPVGKPNWVVTLNSRTYLEGRVLDPEGQPVAGINLRATRGPFETAGAVWTETETDSDGRYRIYLEPDTYELRVRQPGVGVARYEKVVVRENDRRDFDLQLEPGPTFRARVIDSVTGEPVSGIRLFRWREPGIAGSSNEQGELSIENMLPGRYEFNVSAESEQGRFPHIAGEYARWWSPEALNEWQRLALTDGGSGFQRNFDDLEFDIRVGMEPVTVVVERGVQIGGQVLDPDGMPVAGATVAPAKTGSGNSLTGDTRYSVRTDAAGKYEMRLPASGATKYNLVAHDGAYEQWRTWANGVGELLQTKPGDVLENVQLKLTKPCIIKGRVLDAKGKPAANHQVRAHSADKFESRYYDPTTKTNDKGDFELRFVRPGKHYVQADPFWITAEDAPENTWKLVEVKEGGAVEDVELRLQSDGRPSPLGAFLLEVREKSAEKD